MAALLLPGGTLQGEVERLNLAPMALALLCFSHVLLLAWLSRRARIPVLAIVVACAGAMAMPPLLRSSGRPQVTVPAHPNLFIFGPA